MTEKSGMKCKTLSMYTRINIKRKYTEMTGKSGMLHSTAKFSLGFLEL